MKKIEDPFYELFELDKYINLEDEEDEMDKEEKNREKNKNSFFIKLKKFF
jgi:hypothetical protein